MMYLPELTELENELLKALSAARHHLLDGKHDNLIQAMNELFIEAGRESVRRRKETRS